MLFELSVKYLKMELCPNLHHLFDTGIKGEAESSA